MYAMQHFATDDSSYVIHQSNLPVATNTMYSVMSWVNIPSTSDIFLVQIEVLWNDASNRVISTGAIKTYTTHTNGTWDLALGIFVPPPEATTASMRMVVSSLDAVIYVDDVGIFLGNTVSRSAARRQLTPTPVPGGRAIRPKPHAGTP
jgi:hypothetical protein